MQKHQKGSKFPFDLGRAFPTLTTYLTTTDKMSLASTCKLLNTIIYSSSAWHRFNIHDFDVTTSWFSYLNWIHKYIQIIQPESISVSILSKQHEEDKELLKIFLKTRNYVREVEIQNNSNLLHLAIGQSCPNIESITFHSSIVSDQLVEAITKNCPVIKSIDINADSLDFTGQNMASYIKNPLQRLILKPYQLDYQAIIRLLLHKELNKIFQLEIDVEECNEVLLPKITSHLPYIRKLRMFHMENFEDQITLAKTLTNQISEITLTKCYKLNLNLIIDKIASPNLEKLDLTQAIFLRDKEILGVATTSQNLKWLNISWCNELTNTSVRQVVQRCLKLEGLILNGIKALNDDAFSEYLELKQEFNEKLYDEIRFDFKKMSKQNKNVQEIFDKLEKKTQVVMAPIQGKPRSLRNIRHLECNSCNNISDKILKVIYCANRMSKVINYYGEVLSLYYTSDISDDQYY